VGPGVVDAFGAGAAVGMFGGIGETKNFRDRLGMSRLSTMMHELEGLRIGGAMNMSSNLGSGFSFAHRLGVS